jgi:hypothetical protein
LSLSLGLVITLLVAYIGLIAVVMSYAALTMEFSQSVRSDESAVARLEAEYLTRVAAITDTDYASLGYAKPASLTFVRAESATALR